MRWILALFVFVLPALAWAEIGQIKLVLGDVSLVRAGETMSAKAGQLIETTDTIVTGKDGRIGITFKDNSRFSAGPNSRIEVTTFDFDSTTHEGEFVTTVDRGTLAIVSGNIARQRPEAMRVRTPSSILGVRGTKFVVRVEP